MSLRCCKNRWIIYVIQYTDYDYVCKENIRACEYQTVWTKTNQFNHRP